MLPTRIEAVLPLCNRISGESNIRSPALGSTDGLNKALWPGCNRFLLTYRYITMLRVMEDFQVSLQGHFQGIISTGRRFEHDG